MAQGEVKNKEEKCKQLQRKTDRQNVKGANSYRERQTECKRCKQLQRKTDRQNVKGANSYRERQTDKM